MIYTLETDCMFIMLAFDIDLHVNHSTFTHSLLLVLFCYVLGKEGNGWIKILLILVCVCPDCSDCCGQLVTPDAIQ